MPVWVVTGANRGLGLEFITQLSQNPSNKIIATVRNSSKTTPALTDLQTQNKNLHILSCDTSDLASITAFSKQVHSILGEGEKINYLLNNAGINAVPEQTALSLTAEGLQAHINTNVIGPAKTTELLLPLLASGSVIMNMSSGLGSISYALERQKAISTTYSISKAALNMLTAHQSLLLKERGIVVICMDPGWVRTDMGGKDALLEREESIGGMLKVLAGLKMEDSGKYYEYSGREIGW